jgi:hypothetical protein
MYLALATNCRNGLSLFESLLLITAPPPPGFRNPPGKQCSKSILKL